MADAARQNEKMECFVAKLHFFADGVKDNTHRVAHAADNQPD